MAFPSSGAPAPGDITVRLDPAVVAQLYEVVWLLHPNTEVAQAVTRWTFEVASMRADQMPAPALVDAWLVAIADRELRRLATVRDRPDLAVQIPTGGEPTARLVAALSRLDPRRRLAVVLRYRLKQPPLAVAAALLTELTEAEQLIAQGARRAARHAGLPVSAVAGLPIPKAPTLPAEVTPLHRLEGRNRLDYRWGDNGFPTATDHDNSTRRWLMAAATAVALVVAAMIGAADRSPDDRPHLEPPPVTSVAIGP